MGLDNKYGQVNIPGIPDDEPVFILRAKDSLAIDSIADYQQRVTHAYTIKGKESAAFVDDLEECIEKFIVWAEANPDKMKLPD